MNRDKALTLCKSILWGIFILLFPISSGVLSAISALEIVETLFLQGTFMFASLVVPLVFVLIGKWKLNEIGFDRYNIEGSKKVFHFLPLLAIFVPVAVHGFYFKSFAYACSNLFLYLAVGIAEEVYFRGIIPKYLSKAFSSKEILLISTAIFGIGHITTVFTANNILEILLTILNAFIFGWLAIEIVVISKNIIPTILTHFFFDFETKIIVMSGNELLIAECIRGTIMVIVASWLFTVINEDSTQSTVL